MKKIVIILTLIPQLLFAQNFDSIKYEMIKKTVNFYAKDVETFPAALNDAGCKALDYKCLERYCDKLDGVKAKVVGWEDSSSGSKEDIAKLSKTILDAVFAKNTDTRNELDSQFGYRKGMQSLVALAAAPTVHAGSGAATSAATTLQQHQESLTPPEKPIDTMSLVALVIAILSFILGIFNLYKFNTRHSARQASSGARTEEANSGSRNSNDDLFSIRSEINALKSNLAQKVATEDLASIRTAINVLTAKVENMVPPNGGSEVSRSPQEPRPAEIKKVVENASHPTRGQMMYAKIPDLQTAFSSDVLVDSQNGEQTFEMELKSDTGTFWVTDNIDAQKYAFSDLGYVLSNACDYNNQPTKNTRIKTIKNGVITKSGSNWVIKTKALIEFK